MQAVLAELRRRAREELARRIGTPEHTAYVKADIIRRLHDKQRAVVAMVFAFVRFIAAECSRRAGKTHVAAAVIVLKLIEAKRGQEVVFCAPTLARGKELIWAELERMLDEYGYTPERGWKRTSASGKIRTASGALFRIVGLDNKRQVGKISRGGNTILFITDETQEFPHLLEALLVAAGPALAQSRGCFLALGSPTVNESDYWARICDGEEGFVHVHWTLRDNPYLGRDPDELLAEERERHGWAEDHPTYVREYLGKRCRDGSVLVLEWSKRNEVTEIEGYKPEDFAKWRHFIGIDFGLSDATAWVVLAAPMHGAEVFVVHHEQARGLSWDDVAERTHRLCTLYKPQGVVGDSASGGAQFLQTFNMRYASKLKVFARSASKHDKPASISVMNTELRTARMRVLMLSDGTKQLAREATALQWADPERSKILEGSAYPEDAFDAWRYAFNDFWAFFHDAEEKEDDEDKRVRERNEREAARQASVRRLRAG